MATINNSDITPPASLVRAREAVERIEKFLAGDVTDGVRKEKLGTANGTSKELERYSMGELFQLLSYWKRRLAAEERAFSGKPLPKIRYAI